MIAAVARAELNTQRNEVIMGQQRYRLRFKTCIIKQIVPVLDSDWLSRVGPWFWLVEPRQSLILIGWAALEAVVNYSTNLCLRLCVAQQPLCWNHRYT